MEKQEDYRLYLYQLPENDHFDRVHAVLVTHDGRILLRYKNGEARITGGHIMDDLFFAVHLVLVNFYHKTAYLFGQPK